MKLLKKYFNTALILVVLIFSNSCKDSRNAVEKENPKNTKPNIVIIYADDLGYGDLSSYGGIDINTPNIDRLIKGGIKFTNGYASSATCSPSRYALLTGRYPWRNDRAKILAGTAPLLIGQEEGTIPKMLKSKGYRTGVVGKWHLGLGKGEKDWNKHISPSPNEVGFDYSYIMAATQDRVPTVYIENGDVVNLDPDDPLQVNYKKNFEGEPTGLENPELTTMKWHHGHNNSIVNGIPRIGFMKGGESAIWKDSEMAKQFLGVAQNFIKKNDDKPFFLYYALQQPHVPRTPSPEFVGKSGMGPRGDVILEADWVVGEFLKTLEKEGVLDNTLIVFSSDNGPVLNDGYYDQAVEKLGDHKPAGDLRGGKYSLFEAGTRVPFAVYWKSKISPGVSDALVSQIDIFTSLSHLVGSNMKGPDSQNFLDVFLGRSDNGRNSLVLEATSRTAFREGHWVMIPPYDGPAINKKVNIELGNSNEFKLYDLRKDISQSENVASKYPDTLNRLVKDFVKIRGKNYGSVEDLELK